MKVIPPPKITLPPAWTWLVDDAIPALVKERYTPDPRWKSKPFSAQDARYYMRGIQELSDFFTEDRMGGMPAYFQQPKFRSSYLLYFVPLQASKFLTLFDVHPEALEAMMAHARAQNCLRIVDLGAGPATASIALALKCIQLKGDLPPIEIHLVDQQPKIMDDGKKLLESLSSHFPKLRNRISVHTYAVPWWEAHQKLTAPASITLVGNLLNEASSGAAFDRMVGSLEPWFKNRTGAGILFVEPAFKAAAQLLSRVRDRALDASWLEKESTVLWGPCPHTGACPLAQGRDWCHFSYPIEIPGKWFKQFSKNLSAERLWSKFSYLWVSAPEHPAPAFPKGQKLVISDPMPLSKSQSTLLVCEPGRPGRVPVSAKVKVTRGGKLT